MSERVMVAGVGIVPRFGCGKACAMSWESPRSPPAMA